MKPGARIAAAIELRQKLHEQWANGASAPADTVLKRYSKDRRYIGSKDRREISRLLFQSVRQHGRLQWHLEQAGHVPSGRSLILAALALLDEQSADTLRELFNGDTYCPEPLAATEIRLLQSLSNRLLQMESMPEAVRFNFPQWMADELHAAFGEKLPVAMTAMETEPTVDLRANSLKASQDIVADALANEGITAAPTPHAPHGLRLNARAALTATRAFRDGLFEMQDEGSQLITEWIGAKPGDRGIDYCAGAGGKTLALAAQMQNTGTLHAWDITEARLKQLPGRITRAGVTIVQPAAITDELLVAHHQSADWVLVDAPCTATGLWRRSPDLRLRTSAGMHREVCVKQCDILQRAAPLVKPGGRLIYATCSVLPSENEKQIEAFLMENGEFTASEKYHRLCPHSHGTDGFFAAILARA